MPHQENDRTQKREPSVCFAKEIAAKNLNEAGICLNGLDLQFLHRYFYARFA